MDAFVPFVGFLIFVGIGYFTYKNWPGRDKDEPAKGKPQRQDDGGDAKK